MWALQIVFVVTTIILIVVVVVVIIIIIIIVVVIVIMMNTVAKSACMPVAFDTDIRHLHQHWRYVGCWSDR